MPGPREGGVGSARHGQGGGWTIGAGAGSFSVWSVAGPAIRERRGGASANLVNRTFCDCSCVPLITRGVGSCFVGLAPPWSQIHDADELIAFYYNGHGPRPSCGLWPGRYVPDPVGLHALLATRM